MRLEATEQEIEEIMRHFVTTGEDQSRSEFAYMPPFPRPTSEELKLALCEEMRKRERGRPRAVLPEGIETLSLARGKATPMVRGFFSLQEREPIQQLLENSVVFLTADNISAVIKSSRWLHTA
jgi:hypothetical protein